MGSKLKLHWYLFFLHEGSWLCDEKKQNANHGGDPESSTQKCNMTLFKIQINKIINVSRSMHKKPSISTKFYVVSKGKH
jgi:hypothetical protein